MSPSIAEAPTSVNAIINSRRPDADKATELGQLAHDFAVRNALLSTAVAKAVSALDAIVAGIDQSKMRLIKSHSGPILNARQFLYVFRKSQEELYLVPGPDAQPTYGLGLVKQVLLGLPLKSGQRGFDRKVAAIRAINELIKELEEAA